MENDIDALIKNKTRRKCIIPKGKKLKGYGWVFTIKYKVDGKIKRYKAWLVAKSYNLTYSIYCLEQIKNGLCINLLSRTPFCTVRLLRKSMLVPPSFCQDFLVGEGCRLPKDVYGLKYWPKSMILKDHFGNEEIRVSIE